MNQLITLESADDEQGFNWWLAVVSGTAFQHKGKACTTSAGVKLVKDGWYLSSKYYDRTPRHLRTALFSTRRVKW
jgi:hypothetical protein